MRARNAEIRKQAETGEHINPVKLLSKLNELLPDNSTSWQMGDFVGTAAIFCNPAAPCDGWTGRFRHARRRWRFLHSGQSSMIRTQKYGWLRDGSSAFSIAEFDTYVRHGVGVIAWSVTMRVGTRLPGSDRNTEDRCRHSVTSWTITGCRRVRRVGLCWTTQENHQHFCVLHKAGQTRKACADQRHPE